ncbi:Protein of unknown function DUF2174 [Methanobacterium lacus]|uniref:GyrI-like small molecule binding domain-containing protein n=1 Tax=Methanobacterium lacus (strain AL-21) TaxID=877455 RepID=F0T9E0_METLA|nr:GyrI-like domain-containing protein [Methanobacterium lacus]ADZ09891.1 Protein of unknown function DUF2174 [Methanobacterium lacus]
MTIAKIDLKKENRELYYPKKGQVNLIDVPEMNFLLLDGEGDPNTSQEYQNAMETIFPVSYKVKFMSKKELDRDYVVMPLEGLWWTDNMEDFSVEDKDGWKWTVMIRQPDFIDIEMVNSVVEEISKKKELPSIKQLRLEKFREGKSAQILHVGPFSEEGPTVEKLHEYIEANGYSFDGSLDGTKHHEIYLSDIRRSKPENLKTVIRQPVN